jgi:hypothetical protein
MRCLLPAATRNASPNARSRFLTWFDLHATRDRLDPPIVAAHANCDNPHVPHRFLVNTPCCCRFPLPVATQHFPNYDLRHISTPALLITPPHRQTRNLTCPSSRFSVSRSRTTPRPSTRLTSLKSPLSAWSSCRRVSLCRQICPSSR